jgi:hypothetical protein
MRDYVILTIFVLGVAWAVDVVEFEAAYSRAAWQQTVDEGRSISGGLKSAVDKALLGKCGLCG